MPAGQRGEGCSVYQRAGEVLSDRDFGADCGAQCRRTADLEDNAHAASVDDDVVDKSLEDFYI